MFVTALPKSEQELAWLVMKDLQKKLGLTNNEKDKRAVAMANKKTRLHDRYQAIAFRKDAVGMKLGSQIKDLGTVLRLHKRSRNQLHLRSLLKK
jgi:hypothetical protein